VQLEKGDDNNALWMPVVAKHNEVHVACRMCGTMMIGKMNA
jgi:hypothetical protein